MEKSTSIDLTRMVMMSVSNHGLRRTLNVPPWEIVWGANFRRSKAVVSKVLWNWTVSPGTFTSRHRIGTTSYIRCRMKDSMSISRLRSTISPSERNGTSLLLSQTTPTLTFSTPSTDSTTLLSSLSTRVVKGSHCKDLTICSQPFLSKQSLQPSSRLSALSLILRSSSWRSLRR